MCRKREERSKPPDKRASTSQGSAGPESDPIKPRLVRGRLGETRKYCATCYAEIFKAAGRQLFYDTALGVIMGIVSAIVFLGIASFAITGAGGGIALAPAIDWLSPVVCASGWAILSVTAVIAIAMRLAMREINDARAVDTTRSSATEVTRVETLSWQGMENEAFDFHALFALLMLAVLGAMCIVSFCGVGGSRGMTSGAIAAILLVWFAHEFFRSFAAPSEVPLARRIADQLDAMDIAKRVDDLKEKSYRFLFRGGIWVLRVLWVLLVAVIAFCACITSPSEAGWKCYVLVTILAGFTGFAHWMVMESFAKKAIYSVGRWRKFWISAGIVVAVLLPISLKLFALELARVYHPGPWVLVTAVAAVVVALGLAGVRWFPKGLAGAILRNMERNKKKPEVPEKDLGRSRQANQLPPGCEVQWCGEVVPPWAEASGLW